MLDRSPPSGTALRPRHRPKASKGATYKISVCGGGATSIGGGASAGPARRAAARGAAGRPVEDGIGFRENGVSMHVLSHVTLIK